MVKTHRLNNGSSKMSTFESPESVNVTSYGKAVYVFMQGDYVEVSEMD